MSKCLQIFFNMENLSQNIQIAVNVPLRELFQKLKTFITEMSTNC